MSSAAEIFDSLPHPPRASEAARAHPAYAAARRSWAGAMARDKEYWLSAFASDAVVEDPVGPSMYSEDGSGQRGKAMLSDFFDASIAVTSSLEFDMVDAIACGDEAVFLGTLRVGLGDNVMDTDIVINYRVDESGLLRNLRAFWEFERASATIHPAS